MTLEFIAQLIVFVAIPAAGMAYAIGKMMALDKREKKGGPRGGGGWL